MSTNESNIVNLEELMDLIEQGRSKILSAKEQDVVLVLGNTGSGKSTFINKIIGNKLEKTFGLTDSYQLADGEVGPYIGQSLIESETTFPECFKVKGKDITLMDTAGMNDSRQATTKAAINIGSEMSLRMARSVSSVIVVVNLNELLAQRADGLRSLLTTLHRIFKDPENIMPSTQFVITHTERVTKAAIIEHLTKMHHEFHAKLYSFKLKNDSDSESGKTSPADERLVELAAQHELLSLMLNDHEKIHLANYQTNKDAKQFRTKVLKTQAMLPKLEATDIKLNNYSEAHNQLEKSLSAKALESKQILDLLKSNLRSTHNAKCEIEFFKTELNKLDSISVDDLEGEKQLLLLKRSLIDKIARYDGEDGFIKKSDNEIKQIESKRKAVVSRAEEPRPFRKLIADEKLQWWNPTWRKVPLSFHEEPTEPYTRTIKRIGNGSFYEDDESQKTNGIYKGMYKSDWRMDADADVSLYRRHCDKKENKELAKDYDKQINSLRDTRTQLNKTRSEFEIQLKDLEQGRASQTIELKIHKEELGNQVLKLKKELANNQNEYKQKSDLLSKYLDVMKFIELVNSYFNFDSFTIDEFSELFKDYQSTGFKINEPVKSLSHDVEDALDQSKEQFKTNSPQKTKSNKPAPRKEFQLRLNNQKIPLYQKQSSGQGNGCAFHTLGTTRSEAVRLLLENKDEQSIREIVAHEIMAKGCISLDLPGAMDEFKNEIQNIKLNLVVPIESERDKQVAFMNSKLGVEGLNLEDLLDRDDLDADYKDLLLNINNRLSGAEKKIIDYCSSVEIYQSYINNFVAIDGNMMGVEAQTNVIEALAKIIGFNIRVWQVREVDQDLYLARKYIADETYNYIDMFHCNCGNTRSASGQNHFNLLLSDSHQEISAASQKPKPAGSPAVNQHSFFKAQPKQELRVTLQSKSQQLQNEIARLQILQQQIKQQLSQLDAPNAPAASL